LLCRNHGNRQQQLRPAPRISLMGKLGKFPDQENRADPFDCRRPHRTSPAFRAHEIDECIACYSKQTRFNFGYRRIARAVSLWRDGAKTKRLESVHPSKYLFVLAGKISE